MLEKPAFCVFSAVKLNKNTYGTKRKFRRYIELVKKLLKIDKRYYEEYMINSKVFYSYTFSLEQKVYITYF